MKALFTSLMILMVSLTFAQTPKFTYIDGNGNAYELYDGYLKYVPVKASNSSSGTYSGGDPKTIELLKQDVSNLETLFQAAIDKKDEQTTTNTMGTATIKFRKLNRDMKVYMTSGSATKTALENALIAKKGN